MDAKDRLVGESEDLATEGRQDDGLLSPSRAVLREIFERGRARFGQILEGAVGPFPDKPMAFLELAMALDLGLVDGWERNLDFSQPEDVSQFIRHLLLGAIFRTHMERFTPSPPVRFEVAEYIPLVTEELGNRIARVWTEVVQAADPLSTKKREDLTQTLPPDRILPILMEGLEISDERTPLAENLARFLSSRLGIAEAKLRTDTLAKEGSGSV